MADGFNLIFEEPEFSIGTFENGLIWSYRGEATLRRIEHGLAVHQTLAVKYPKGFSVMTIVSPEVPLTMPSDARELSTRITRDYQPYYCGICEVIEGDGFRGSVARSVVAGVRLVARSTVPAKVFSDASTASRWLGTLMAPGARGEKVGVGLAAAAQLVRRYSKS